MDFPSNKTVQLQFEVVRCRPSATQGEAKVFCNGQFITSFADELKPIEKGEKYYGPMIGGYASIMPDEDFIYAALWHKYDFIYWISGPIRKIVNKRRFEEDERDLWEEKRKRQRKAGKEYGL